MGWLSFQDKDIVPHNFVTMDPFEVKHMKYSNYLPKTRSMKYQPEGLRTALDILVFSLFS